MTGPLLLFLGFYLGAGFATATIYAFAWDRGLTERDGPWTRADVVITFALWWLALYVCLKEDGDD